MEDEIVLIALEIIQGGLIQMDFHNESKDERFRVFVEPESLFKLLGASMQKNYEGFMDRFLSNLYRKG